jgi:hypothetical protein
VNEFFAATTQNIAHFTKRQMALEYIASGQAPDEFLEAAEIEGMHVNDYAALVASKPDEMMLAENKRRRLVVTIRAATTVEEITGILAAEGLTQANSGDALPIV